MTPTSTKADFLNRVRSLFNIDGDQLPELNADAQRLFVHDPVRYFMSASATAQTAIWREIEKRQVGGIAA